MSEAISIPTSLGLREDHRLAIERAWSSIAAAGTWWTGAERIAIAREVREARNCEVCRSRKQALSPYAGNKRHTPSALLPEAIVDMIHRVVSAPGRLSSRVVDDVVAAGHSPSIYVETLGVVVRTVNIDMLCKAIGIAEFDLPEPVPGNPSGYVPEGLVEGIAWVPMLTNPNSEFEGQSLPNVGRALSAVPDEVRAIGDLAEGGYMAIEQVGDPSFDPGFAINRAQMELIAGRISALNECFY